MDSQVKKKSKAVKIVYITIISLVLVLISYIGIKKYYKCKEQDKEKNKEIEFYKTEVDKYLYDTYGKNFDIEFKEKKYYITGPATDFAHCEGPVDQNIENFKFTFSSFDSKEVKGYVSALHNITTDEVEIVETNEFNSYERNPELYNEHLKLYYQKKEIESKVKSLAGNDYDVDLYSDANYVILKTKRTFREIISNDVNKFESMFNELKKLVNNKDVKVKIWFSPTERHDALCGTNVSPSYTEGFITTDYSYYYIDAIIQIEKESMEIEKNFNKIKTVVNFGEYGEELIHIYFNTKYDEKFESDIQKYKDIANNKYYKYMEIMLEFKDETITVKSDINYNSINNLSKEIIDKVKSLAGNDYDVSTGTITLIHLKKKIFL